MKQNGSPYYEQLRDAIIRAIQSGQLQPGDRLPSLHEVTEKFGVSKNTGIRAYHELEMAGWVKISRRSGTLVQVPPVHRTQPGVPLAEAIAEFHQALDSLHAAGVPADRLRAALDRVIAERWSPRHAPAECVVLVNEDPFNVDVDVADIEQAIGLGARRVPFDDVRDLGPWALGDIRQVRAILVTSYRYSQVRRILNPLGLPTIPMGVTTDPRVAQEAVQYNRPGVRLAVIAPDAVFFAPLDMAVRQFLFNAEVIGQALLDEKSRVRELAEQADVIVGGYWLTDPQGVAEITLGKPAIALGTRADPNSLHLVKQALEEARQAKMAPAGDSPA
jgi:GntR family transcriptional regulator